MTRLILAIQFLTRLPTPQVSDFRPERLAESARWFPLVGLLLGALLLAAVWPAARLDPWLAAWAGVLAWALLTGGLHLDGLADVADALGAAHRDRERLLAVMKDPHLGSFGVLTLILHLAGKLVLLMLLARGQHWAALLLIPAWARLGVLFWQTLPALSPGMGEQFAWALPRRARWAWLLALLAASAWAAPALLATPVAIWLYRRWLLRTLGGMSGDCLGAGVEVVELAALLLAVALQMA
ncbi:adenosylcobinamide-GDP ribazoletransferase [Chitinivorax sp. PXF-14]|uniref:adenosylcobinamide-GDP ribazoletransferase n=1 Tax=Chitinivorax sp. PXF-14 TaxID=3230488 RepID=UPI0034675BAB